MSAQQTEIIDRQTDQTQMTEEARNIAIKVLELIGNNEGTDGLLERLKAGGNLEERYGGYILNTGWTADGGFWYPNGSCRIEKDGYITAEGLIAHILKEAKLYKEVVAYKRMLKSTEATTFNGYSQKKMQELIAEGYTEFKAL